MIWELSIKNIYLMNHVSTEAINIGRKIHTGMGMFIRIFGHCIACLSLIWYLQTFLK
jgi:hypothetical protein